VKALPCNATESQCADNASRGSADPKAIAGFLDFTVLEYQGGPLESNCTKGVLCPAIHRKRAQTHGTGASESNRDLVCCPTTTMNAGVG
jgi:hypothetical protein